MGAAFSTSLLLQPDTTRDELCYYFPIMISGDRFDAERAQSLISEIEAVKLDIFKELIDPELELPVFLFRGIALYFNKCDLKKEGMANLSSFLEHNTTVKVLWFDRNELTVNKCKQLGNILKESNAITSLYIREESLVPNQVNNLTKYLKKNSTLNTLSVVCPEFDDECVNVLTGNLQKNQSVEKLKIVHSNVSDQGMIDLAELLRVNTTLKTLQICYNHIDCSVDDDLLFFSPLSYEKDLEEPFSQITLAGIEALSGALSNNESLNSLTLIGVNICVEGAVALEHALSSNSSLTTLRLPFCNIDDTKLAHITNSLKHAKCLRELHLKDNLITDHGLQVIVDLISSQTRLISLSLGGNFLNDEGALLIANTLPSLDSLEELDLSEAGITDEGFNNLRIVVANHFNLKRITLVGNFISAEQTRRWVLMHRSGGERTEILLPETRETGTSGQEITRRAPTLERINEDQHPRLLESICDHDIDTVEQLTLSGVPLHRNIMGTTPLHEALGLHNFQLLTFLLEQEGLDLDLPRSGVDPTTPLELAELVSDRFGCPGLAPSLLKQYQSHGPLTQQQINQTISNSEDTVVSETEVKKKAERAALVVRIGLSRFSAELSEQLIEQSQKNTLVSLNLKQTPLSIEQVKQLGEWLSANKSLNLLSLVDCNVNGTAVHYLANGLVCNSSVQVLELSQNAMAEEEGLALLYVATGNSTLVTLALKDGNAVPDQLIDQIDAEISKNVDLANRLVTACQKGEVDQVIEIHTQGASLSVFINETTPLHEVIDYQQPQVLPYLLSQPHLNPMKKRVGNDTRSAIELARDKKQEAIVTALNQYLQEGPLDQAACKSLLGLSVEEDTTVTLRLEGAEDPSDASSSNANQGLIEELDVRLTAVEIQQELFVTREEVSEAIRTNPQLRRMRVIEEYIESVPAMQQYYYHFIRCLRETVTGASAAHSDFVENNQVHTYQSKTEQASKMAVQGIEKTVGKLSVAGEFAAFVLTKGFKLGIKISFENRVKNFLGNLEKALCDVSFFQTIAGEIVIQLESHISQLNAENKPQTSSRIKRALLTTKHRIKKAKDKIIVNDADTAAKAAAVEDALAVVKHLMSKKLDSREDVEALQGELISLVTNLEHYQSVDKTQRSTEELEQKLPEASSNNHASHIETVHTGIKRSKGKGKQVVRDQTSDFDTETNEELSWLEALKKQQADTQAIIEANKARYTQLFQTAEASSSSRSGQSSNHPATYN